MKLKKLFLLLPVFALASCSNAKTITAQEAKDLINNAETIEVVNTVQFEQSSEIHVKLKGSDGVTVAMDQVDSYSMAIDVTDEDSMYYYNEVATSSSYKVTGTGAEGDAATSEAEYYSEIVATDTGYLSKNLSVVNNQPSYSESVVDASSVASTIFSDLATVLVGLNEGSDLDLFVSQVSSQFDDNLTVTYQTHGSDVIVNLVGNIDGGSIVSGLLDGVAVELKVSCTFENNVLVHQTTNASVKNLNITSDDTSITGSVSLSNSSDLTLNKPITNKDRVSNPNA